MTDTNHENRAAVSVTDMEQITSYASLGTEEVKRLNTQVSIHVHSVRKRLADADGISAKAAIDGLIHAGVLPDDSPKWVQSVSFSQEKGKEEKTVIYIEPVDKCKELEGGI